MVVMLRNPNNPNCQLMSQVEIVVVNKQSIIIIYNVQISNITMEMILDHQV